MTEVLQYYEDSLCADCGTHAHLAFDPQNTGKFVVDDSTQCVVCEAREQYTEPVDPWPGTKLRIISDF